jgi:hypothetical protein
MAEVAAQNKRPRIKKSQLALTPEELTNRYLWGVDLTNDEGAPYSKKDLEFYIRSAQEWFQKQIPGICLFPTEIVNERHDYYANDFMAFGFMKLFRYPMQSVSKIAMQFPLSNNLVEFESSWWRAEATNSHVSLIPTSNSIQSLLMTQGGSSFFNGSQNLPFVWSVDYKAGFELGDIPSDILDIIGLKASIMPLTIAGDLIAGAGVASKSISVDGLSQSINTTASAENTGYSANIKHREKEIESRLKHMKEYYIGISMVVA